jgi:AcrR family transcriptional regulator
MVGDVSGFLPMSGKARVAPTGSLARAPSLREKHKNQTGQAIRHAALKLFASNGYDATTTEMIAERAGVSARTFFRYFPTKESLLFFGEQDWFESMADEYPRQPESLSDLEALISVIELQTPRLSRRRHWLLLFDRAIASSPTLRGLEEDHHLQNTEVLAQAIAARRGKSRADEGAHLLAAVVVLTYRRAVDIWLAGSPKGDLSKIITKEFSLLREQITS